VLIIPVVVQGGNQVCQVACIAAVSILQLKVKVEVEAGLEARTLAIYMPEIERPLGESVTLEGCGMPSKLYALKLHSVDIAVLVGVFPRQLTDAHLANACLTDDCGIDSIHYTELYSPQGRQRFLREYYNPMKPGG
jgi:hypothetical protein